VAPDWVATLYHVDDRVLITVSEAARRLGTYPNAINRWIAKGELEAFRVEGRGLRFVDAEQVEGLRLALQGIRQAR
jgi:excisionase family DNA binding protein